MLFLVMILWVHAKSSKDRRHNSWAALEKTQFTYHVKSALSSCPQISENLCANSSYTEFSRSLAENHDKVIAVALCRGSFSPTVATFLNQNQLEVRDFWLQSPLAGHPIAYFEFIEIFSLERPCRVYDSAARSNRSGLFVQPTAMSMDMLRNSLLGNPTPNSPRAAGELLPYWKNTHPDLCNTLEDRTCITIVLPHALLLMSQRWRHYAIPIPTAGRSLATMRLKLAKPLWAHLAQNAQPINALGVSDAQYGPETLQEFADQMRLQLARGAGDDFGEYDRAALTHSIAWAQTLRDELVMKENESHAKGYSVASLLSALLLSGYMRDSATLRTTLTWAIRTITSGGELRDYLLKQLSQPHAVPTKTTLQRHRFTLHMGMCRWLQELNDELMKDPIISWRTMDGSPQGGYDLLLHGAIVMKRSKVAEAMVMAN